MFKAPKQPKFRFIDLFCGIGGFRIAFQNAGGECVFSCDWDKFSRQTYEANFGEQPEKNIHDVDIPSIKPFDILCAGFPCQPFSLAGVSKKNSLGRKHGFEDQKQGNLFFKIKEILELHKPAAFVLENVKHLYRHDGGNTYKTIIDILRSELGYHVHPAIIDAQALVPQHRERISSWGLERIAPLNFPASMKPVPSWRVFLILKYQLNTP
jgi:DNA (cytosine-5)-methyltransferase 1